MVGYVKVCFPTTRLECRSILILVLFGLVQVCVVTCEEDC